MKIVKCLLINPTNLMIKVCNSLGFVPCYDVSKDYSYVFIGISSMASFESIKSDDVFDETLPCVCFLSDSNAFYFTKNQNTSLVQIPVSYKLQNMVDKIAKELKPMTLRMNPYSKRGLPKCPDLSTPRSVLPPLIGSDGLTDFPKKGLDKEIDFENSQYKMFDLELALYLAKEFPKKWCKGGNHFGNKAFSYWIETMRAIEKGKPIPKDCQRWLKKRERYIARHRGDFRLAGVVAMIKWAGFIDGENGAGNGSDDGSSIDYMLSLF